MCTSFVVHSKKTFIGMNFDNKNPIKIMIKDDNQFLVLVNENGQFTPSFGCNRNGTFMNTLMVDSNEDGKYRRGKNVIHIMRLLEDILGEKIKPDSLRDLFKNNLIVNVPNYSVHSMIAGKNKDAYIVEPGRNNIDISSFNRDFMVLSCFPLSDYIGEDYTKVKGTGAERYKKAYEMIIKNHHSFNIDVGFSILKETMQQEGDYPTQFSMVSIPEENVIYFTINGDFTKGFEFSFLDNKIRTGFGFAEKNSYLLSKKGILLCELENLIRNGEKI
ncbi:hypothetical protein GCM10008905_14270 [Clostridium malenominatum]|uniref:Choloylglycine hydrolase n=1 Tax=Clostridium malenominatum TaxID=1539 RepID=A0ABP3U650_9CLOT